MLEHCGKEVLLASWPSQATVGKPGKRTHSFSRPPEDVPGSGGFLWSPFLTSCREVHDDKQEMGVKKVRFGVQNGKVASWWRKSLFDPGLGMVLGRKIFRGVFDWQIPWGGQLCLERGDRQWHG